MYLLLGVNPDQSEDEPVCEECSQTQNLIHCIDASIQVKPNNGKAFPRKAGLNLRSDKGGF